MRAQEIDPGQYEARRAVTERLGFRRAPEFDMMVEEGRLRLLSDVLELN